MHEVDGRLLEDVENFWSPAEKKFQLLFSQNLKINEENKPFRPYILFVIQIAVLIWMQLIIWPYINPALFGFTVDWDGIYCTSLLRNTVAVPYMNDIE